MLDDYNEHLIKGDDVWVPTVCAGCYNCCGMLVHRVDGQVVEDRDEVDAAQTRQQLGALVLGLDRQVRPFVSAHGAVGVHGDQQDVSARAGVDQRAQVTDVEQVERPVGHHDPLTVGS